MKNEEIQPPSPEQFGEWISEISKAKVKQRNSVAMIGRDIWVKAIGPSYGFSEEECDSMFDRAGADPDGIIYKASTIEGWIAFIHPLKTYC